MSMSTNCTFCLLDLTLSRRRAASGPVPRQLSSPHMFTADINLSRWFTAFSRVSETPPRRLLIITVTVVMTIPKSPPQIMSPLHRLSAEGVNQKGASGGASTASIVSLQMNNGLRVIGTTGVSVVSVINQSKYPGWLFGSVWLSYWPWPAQSSLLMSSNWPQSVHVEEAFLCKHIIVICVCQFFDMQLKCVFFWLAFLDLAECLILECFQTFQHKSKHWISEYCSCLDRERRGREGERKTSYSMVC